MLKGLLGRDGNSKTSNVAVKEKPSAPATVKKSKGQKTAKSSPPSQTKDKTLAEKYRDSLADNPVVTLCDDSPSKENIELVIRAAYRQVFGNAHLMESERLSVAESQIRFGQITVRDFIRQLATSERYRSLFWDKYPTPVFCRAKFQTFAWSCATKLPRNCPTYATFG